MSFISEIGISPVLLQAINLKLTSSAVKSSDQPSNAGNKNKQCCKWTMTEKLSPVKEQDNHILHELNEPTRHFSHNSLYSHKFDKSQNNNLAYPKSENERIKTMIKWKLGQRAVQREEKPETIIITSAEADLNMVNILTAFATQHMKANGKTDTEQVQEVVEEVSSENLDSKQMIICYNNDIATVPSPSNNILVTESDQNGHSIVIQEAATVIEEEIPTTAKHAQYQEIGIECDPQTEMQISLQNETTTGETSQQDVNPGPCPICGDVVSGYHYGIFSCESCKGFFKRTVQNRKTFVCHRNGDCDINKYNRKKCPACRFSKCIMNGMKLEAIRLDRARGGRSSYSGCSPHGRSKPNSSEPKTTKVIRRPVPTPGSEVRLNLGASIPGSHLVAIFKNKSDSKRHEVIKPYVPQLLTDIMNLESLLSEDDAPSEFSTDKLSFDDPDIFLSLMQLTELRLYKLVRWARNLAQFASIATDDQIVLLQHCWSDLLTLSTSFCSISSDGEIQLPFLKFLNSEALEKIGATEILNRITNLTEQLHRLQLDQYEYVALKVIILMCPDVKNLKDTQKVEEQQTRLCDALSIYSSTHYPRNPNKFGEMLLRLPEVSKISMLGKDILTNSVPSNPTSCGLLLELLKGDGVQDT